MSELSKLEYALLCAARAFAACYQDLVQKVEPQGTPKEKKAPVGESNGIPYCKVHGKYHVKSKINSGYYCLDCFLERKNARN